MKQKQMTPTKLLHIKHCAGNSPILNGPLKQNMAQIGEDSDKLIEALGIQNFSGANVLLCMAQNLVEGSHFKNFLAVIGLFDGHLANSLGISEYEWQRKLFNSECTSEVGGKLCIPSATLSK